MHRLPVISIVTPSLNQAEYLEECIESVLGQGYPGLEYVIMDGGSTDGSVEIIKKYEKHLKYWQSCPDGGQYRAIQAGFQHTGGEVMAWLNSDDKYHPLAFAKVAAIFSGHSEVHWLTGRKSFWDMAGNLSQVEACPAIFSRRKFLEGHFNKPYLQQESTFWRRSLWERAGAAFDTALAYAGDLELWCRFFRFSPLHTLDTLLGGYRFNAGQRADVFAKEYRREAEACIARERHHCLQPLGSLPDPPARLGITREELAAFVQDGCVRPVYPNHTRCWCEYTEDLLAETRALQQERFGLDPAWWINEVALFSLAKPRAAWLLHQPLETLKQAWNRLATQLAQGQQHESLGDYAAAARLLREAVAAAPASAAAAAALLGCLWRQGEQSEALGMLPGVLERHVHDEAVAVLAYEILSGCNAVEQARMVCEEFLMVDPHNQKVRGLLAR